LDPYQELLDLLFQDLVPWFIFVNGDRTVLKPAPFCPDPARHSLPEAAGDPHSLERGGQLRSRPVLPGMDKRYIRLSNEHGDGRESLKLQCRRDEEVNFFSFLRSSYSPCQCKKFK